VDTKKKELVGRYANGGVEWQPAGEPERVNVHDFPDPQLGKAIPYGVYDLGANTGWISVGTDHDTAAFAVATLRRWWEHVGSRAYPEATRLLVTADAGGSNGYRVRAWNTELARFAAETGLGVTVCHFPPGTSKWNKIEHRLFSHISMNWRGRPLVSHEVIVELIGATTSRTGLTVRAELDRGAYPLGVKVSQRSGAGGRADQAAPMAWQVELHDPSASRIAAGSRLRACCGGRLKAGEQLFQRLLVGPDERLGVRCRGEHLQELGGVADCGR
jgi:hypothetical protein